MILVKLSLCDYLCPNNYLVAAKLLYLLQYNLSCLIYSSDIKMCRHRSVVLATSFFAVEESAVGDSHEKLARGASQADHGRRLLQQTPAFKPEVGRMLF